MGPRETAHLVKYLPCKPGDLNVILRAHVKIFSISLSTSNARTGKAGTGDPLELTSQPS